MLLAAAMLLISSCASLSGSGVGRVKEYVIESDRLPVEFDGCRVAFVSDIHYPSLFGPKRLPKLSRRLNEAAPDILLLGGDYVTCNDSIDALFASLSSVKTTYGTYAVLGNHERKNWSMIERSMKEHGIVLLADSCAWLCNDGGNICVAGVRDSFVCDSVATSAVSNDVSEAFVILLAHTPDYAERSQSRADLVLSGHAHGGQWRIGSQGIFAPSQGLFPRLTDGVHDGRLVISRGLSNRAPVPRLNNPPEIVYVQN